MTVDTPATCVTVGGGLAVLLSYYIAFRGSKHGYMSPKNPFWLGHTAPAIRALVLVQLVSLVGFFLFVVPWLFVEQPQGGLLEGDGSLAAVMAVFMLASALWAPLMLGVVRFGGGWRLAAAAVLVVAAVCSVLFLAGSVTEREPRWYVVAGAAMFAATIVGADGTGYVSRLLLGA